jgi:hypothetical protein
LPHLKGGVELAGGPSIQDTDVVFPFYGDLFRPEGHKSGGVPYYAANDVQSEMEQELLLAWWEEAARIDPNVQGPDEPGKSGKTLFLRNIVGPALAALSGSSFFVGLADRAMVFLLKQVYAYFHDEGIRAEIQRRVAESVGPDTRLIIGHSLGSVAAYEALCAHREWPVKGLVTLGSPLGIKNLIFERLRPAPRMNGVGHWPHVTAWTNVADKADIVALQRELWNCFGDPLKDVLIDNGAKPHYVGPYLTAKETGTAIAKTLAAAEAT